MPADKQARSQSFSTGSGYSRHAPVSLGQLCSRGLAHVHAGACDRGRRRSAVASSQQPLKLPRTHVVSTSPLEPAHPLHRPAAVFVLCLARNWYPGSLLTLSPSLPSSPFAAPQMPKENGSPRGISQVGLDLVGSQPLQGHSLVSCVAVTKCRYVVVPCH